MDAESNQQHLNYLGTLSIIFYMIVLSASVAGQKLISISGFVISAGSLFFPISYMIVACVTEVYGLKQAKRMILTASLCNFFVSDFLYFVVKIPHAEFWQ